MPGKTPHNSGRKPAENGVRNNKDADKAKGKKPAAKDGDEEMTVVVPPSKSTKQQQSGDADGDVDMAGDDKAEDKVDPAVQAVADIKSNFALLDRAVILFDARFSLRALRSVSLIRKRLTPDIIAQAIVETFPATPASENIVKNLLAVIGRENVTLGSKSGSEMEIDSETSKPTKNGPKKEIKEIIPEIDIFLGILIQVHLFDTKQYEEGADFSRLKAPRFYCTQSVWTWLDSVDPSHDACYPHSDDNQLERQRNHADSTSPLRHLPTRASDRDSHQDRRHGGGACSGAGAMSPTLSFWQA